MQVTHTHDLEKSMRFFIAFGKLIGVYPTKWILIRILPSALLVAVTFVDWVGCFSQPFGRNMSAVDICGRIGSPQFYTVGTFCYIYIQTNHRKLTKFYDDWKKIPVLFEDAHLSFFVNLVFGFIMTSAILENVSFHFKLFPVFEPPVANKTSFEVYYDRSHGYWSQLVPFTPVQATILVITNKMALYAWNYVDLMVIITCRALRFRFVALKKDMAIIDPACAVTHYLDLIELMRLLENYLSPVLFCSFYLDFYATCMQLNMWMTPSNHGHMLHTIYLLWSFVHLIVRMYILSYQASGLHDACVDVQQGLQMISRCCSPKLQKEISRIEWSEKRQLSISGLGCFFITRKFLLTLIYVAFTFQIFLLQSTSVAHC